MKAPNHFMMDEMHDGRRRMHGLGESRMEAPTLWRRIIEIHTVADVIAARKRVYSL